MYFKWLEFSLNESIPASLLLLSRTLFMSPTVAVDEQLKVQFEDYSQIYKALPLREYSATINAIENMYNQWKTDKENAWQVTLLIFKEIQQLCSANKIPVVIIDISNEKNSELASFCSAAGINYLDASINLNRPGYRNLPYDYHPSVMAHELYTKAILNYFDLKKLQLDSD